MTEERFKEIISYIKDEINGTEFEGHLYCCGGAVRDLVMGSNIKDIDMCIDFPDGGVQFANWVMSSNLGSGFAIFPTYGTARFVFKKYPEDEIECVQTRGEQYHDKNSRNPQVTFAPIDEDCVRRDLTMNALYLNVTTGEVIDLTGKGIDDIKNHICRVTNDNPDIVFDDDPLRTLRVIRFASKYGFDIEEKTFQSMLKFIDRLDIISKERITDEFSKMITCANPVMALLLLKESGAMKHIIPEMEKAYDMEQNEYHFGTVWEHTLAVMDNCPNNDLAVRLACVFHDLGKVNCQTRGEDGRIHFYNHETIGASLVYNIMMRMRYPKDLAQEVSFYVKWHMFTKQWGDALEHMKLKTLRKLEYICGTEERFKKLLDVIDADNLSHKSEHCLPNQVTNIMAYVVNEQPYYDKMFGYKLPIDGYDIMYRFNVQPGKEIKQYLDHCLNLAFNNPRITKEECLQHIESDKIKGINVKLNITLNKK